MNDATLPPPHLQPRRSLFLTVVPPIILPVFLSAGDGTVVATALPAIAASFGEVELLSWIIVANLIAGTVAAPAYGRLADLFGRKPMMIAALVVFMAAAVVCALSPNFWWLLAGRVLQGLGGGGLMTLAQALIGELVPPRERGSYQGYLSANIVAGTTIGPVAGGIVTQLWGWHAVFLCYLPIGLLAILLVLRLPSTARRTGRAGFDLTGMLLLTGFIVPLLIAVTQLQRLSIDMLPRLALLLTVAALVLAALIWQQRRAASPLLPLPLLREPSFWRADLMGACSGASLVAMITFLPIYFQVVTGASPAETGMLLIPLTGAVSGGAVVTGWLISRTGRTAIFPTFGLMITGVSLIGLALWGPSLSRGTLSWVLAVGGLCQGTSMITAQITAQAVGGAHHLGAAAASVQLSRSLGSAFGAAAAGAVLFGLLSVMDSDTATLFLDMVKRGPSVLASLPPERRALVQGEIGDAFRGVFLLVACFSGTIVFAASTLPLRRL